MNWLKDFYLLIRGDRFAKDKLETIQKEIYTMNTAITTIQMELDNHQKLSHNNMEVLETKLNANRVASEILLDMISDRFDALNLKIESLRRE